MGPVENITMKIKTSKISSSVDLKAITTRILLNIIFCFVTNQVHAILQLRPLHNKHKLISQQKCNKKIDFLPTEGLMVEGDYKSGPRDESHGPTKVNDVACSATICLWL